LIRLFRFLRPYRIQVTFVLVLVFLQVMSQLYLPTLMADIVDTGIVKGDIPYIVWIGGYMLLITFAAVICTVAASYYSAKISSGLGKILRGKLFKHVENFSLYEFDQIGTSSLVTRTTNDITQVQNVMMMILRMMVMAPLMSIGGLIMAISKDAKLSLVIVVVIPVLILSIWVVARKAIPLFKVMQLKLDKVNLVLREGLIGIRVIRAFNRVEYDKARFDEASLDVTDTAIKANKIMAAMMPLMTLIMSFTSIAIVWFGSVRISHGGMQVGDLMAFLQYAMQIMFSMMMMAMMFVMIPRAQASAVRINEVLEMDSILKDPTTLAKDDLQARRTQDTKGLVEFKNVCFSYPGAEKPAISNINFSIYPGEVTAIIGGTGSGKSTLISLIPRFYDVSGGSITIDGVDIRNMTQETLRSKIGYVPQKAVLFTGTIKDNIRYGKQDASDSEIIHAAEVAQAAEFIAEMKDGYDDILAQSGTNISGGQKQRLSIARALVRKPDIYVFDDSFSALDFKTDAKLRAALKKETTHAAVLIVAQRVSTVMDADRIIVLDNGEIVGNGAHHDLMESCSVYREIVSSQLTEEEIA